MAGDVDELTEDIDEIGQDTDRILAKISHTLDELVQNTKETKSTKKWLITLFAIDKILMFLIIILGLKISGL